MVRCGIVAVQMQDGAAETFTQQRLKFRGFQKQAP